MIVNVVKNGVAEERTFTLSEFIEWFLSMPIQSVRGDPPEVRLGYPTLQRDYKTAWLQAVFGYIPGPTSCCG